VSIKQLEGQTFGRLTAFGIDRSKSKKSAYWICKCQCGNEKSVRSDHLIQGRIRSCGCLLVEARHRSNAFKHGMKGTRIYRIWVSMKNRCNDKSYKDYGERGICVCEKWQNFEGFWEDMKEGYTDALTLDRKDNDGNYCKENCRWATMAQQSLNKRNNHIIEFGGERKPVAEFCQEFGINSSTVYNRLAKGWAPVRALTEPPNKGREMVYYVINGEKLSRPEVARMFKIPASILWHRLNEGWGIGRATSTPVAYRTHNHLE